jgi:hypothetical protein
MLSSNLKVLSTFFCQNKNIEKFQKELVLLIYELVGFVIFFYDFKNFNKKSICFSQTRLKIVRLLVFLIEIYLGYITLSKWIYSAKFSKKSHFLVNKKSWSVFANKKEIYWLKKTLK